MLTSRGFWFLLGVGAVAFWAVPALSYSAPATALLALSLLLWFLFEWGLFLARANAAAGRISVERHILQGGREQPNLWANLDGVVRVTIALKPGAWRLPFVAVADKLPAGQLVMSGSRRAVGGISTAQPLTLEYTLHPVAPGVLRFEGVELRMADLCGLFYRRVFLRLPTEYLVLPTLADDESSRRAVKRQNALPPPGIHRLRRAGGGTELHDLREYIPGDPPKMIAWKASARREVLITKEYENDVPVRCVLFLDASNGMRLGDPGNTNLARAAGIGAAVAQAAAATRDIVGLTVFDENTTTVMKPARTRIHGMQMLRTFAETAGRQPEVGSTDPLALQTYAHSLAVEQYPELLEKRVNSRPLGLFWIPLMDSRARWLLLLPALFYLFVVFGGGFNLMVEITRNIVRPRHPSDLLVFIPVGLLLLLLPVWMTGVSWFLFGIRGFFGKRAKDLAVRKQLAAVFAGLDSDTPAAVERYIHDDDFFVARANRFLAAHHTLPPVALYDEAGNYRFRGEAKLTVLADALVRSVGVARDNELYVILADVVELAADLERLLRAVRAACGRHHQVLVLLPWPDDMPPPRDKRAERQDEKRRKVSIGRLIEDALVADYHRKFDTVRTALVRAGASVIRFNQDDPVQLVLQRMEQLRGGRIRR